MKFLRTLWVGVLISAVGIVIGFKRMTEKKTAPPPVTFMASPYVTTTESMRPAFPNREAPSPSPVPSPSPQKVGVLIDHE